MFSSRILWISIIIGLVSVSSADLRFNELTLNAIDEMPTGGGYATNLDAAIGLRRSNDVRNGNLLIVPDVAVPSYCSGATYLVFLKVIHTLQKEELITLDEKSLKRLLVQGDADGCGFWGRWNANGPGTAKLVADLKVGRNFEDIRSAKKGDFLKIFWSKEIGAQERGHSVIYLGKHQNADGEWEIEYWSSNKPLGYSIKKTKAHFMRWCLFTRIESLEGFEGVTNIPEKDDFLASMLADDYTREVIRERCKISGLNFDQENLQVFLDEAAAPNLESSNSFVKIGERYHIHEVVKGDTLSGLSVKYGVSLADIRDANALSGDVIILGKKLKIPLK